MYGEGWRWKKEGREREKRRDTNNAKRKVSLRTEGVRRARGEIWEREEEDKGWGRGTPKGVGVLTVS